jgi:succinate dehydrogenase hydrophobic anchor subunit
VLVGLWTAALVAWLVALTGYATLNEVTYTPQRFSSSIWSSAAMLVLAGMVILPLVGLMLVLQRTIYLDYHTGNTVRVVGVPLMLLLTGALFSAVDYGLAQAMFRARLSVRSG